MAPIRLDPQAPSGLLQVSYSVCDVLRRVEEFYIGLL
jgi:hypothetical protein